MSSLAQTLWLGSLVALFAVGAAGQATFTFPEDAGVVDVTQPPYNARGDGRTDATAAIQKALDDHPSMDGVIYLPDGVYVISDTLKWPSGPHGGVAQKRVILQGQSAAGTVIRLKDKAAGFTDARKPKAMLWTGQAPAQRFRNGICTLTVNAGRGNPGAIGVQYIANNQGSMRNVLITSEDGKGQIGLDLGYTNEQGPCLIKDIAVVGFDIGISTKHVVDSVTMESIRLEKQNVVGFRNEGQCVSVRGFTSANDVPAIENLGGASLLTLDAGAFTGRGPAAIVNTGSLVLRHSSVAGYGKAVDNGGSKGGRPDAPAGEIDAWVSHPVQTLFETGKSTLDLPVKPTPTPPDAPLSAWAGPHQFGGNPNDKNDDTAAVQKAVDSGARVIYFPRGGDWIVDGTVIVRGNVERITALEGRIRGKGGFRFVDGNADTVFFDRVDLIYQQITLEQATKRTLVVSGITMGGGGFVTQPGAGDLFLEDVCGGPFRFRNQNVWARQLNPESAETKIVNDGGRLWILGLKTERGGTLIETRNGGASEVFGGFAYANTGDEKPPMFINDNSSLSASIGEMVIRKQPFKTLVVETQNGTTRKLTMDQLPGRGGGSMLTLYVGRKP